MLAELRLRKRPLSKKQKSVLLGAVLSLCVGSIVLGRQFRPLNYMGPCYPQGIRLSTPDYSLSALKKRYHFYQRHPLNAEQNREKAPYFKDPEQLQAFWQCDHAKRKIVFLAAYYSLAYFPHENELKVQAVQLLSWSQEPLPGLVQLQREVFHMLLDKETEGNQLARILLDLMQNNNQKHNFAQSLKDYAQWQDSVETKHLNINPGFQQLLLFELAQAQWQTQQNSAALQSLEKGIKQYPGGGWTQKLLTQAQRWQNLISP